MLLNIILFVFINSLACLTYDIDEKRNKKALTLITANSTFNQLCNNENETSGCKKDLGLMCINGKCK
jgi:hypothetical protein